MVSRETWKDITGYDGRYQASTHGRIKAIPRKIQFTRNGKLVDYFQKEIIFTPGFTKKGYLQVCLQTLKGTQVSRRVHRLIADTFIPNPTGKKQVNHISPDKTNNRVENLEWCTNSENHDHKMEHGLNVPCPGEKHGMAILTEVEVLEIRSKYVPRIYTQPMLAREYGVSVPTVCAIITRRLWKHI